MRFVEPWIDLPHGVILSLLVIDLNDYTSWQTATVPNDDCIASWRTRWHYTVNFVIRFCLRPISFDALDDPVSAPSKNNVPCRCAFTVTALGSVTTGGSILVKVLQLWWKRQHNIWTGLSIKQRRTWTKLLSLWGWLVGQFCWIDWALIGLLDIVMRLLSGLMKWNSRKHPESSE